MTLRTSLRTALLIPAAIVIGACDVPTRAGEGWVRASLSGGVTGTYSGTGDFLESGGALNAMKSFTISSRGASATLLVIRENGLRPARGQYSFGWFDPAKAGADRFAVIYEQISADRIDSYASTGGELTIETSSPEEVRGSFRMQAVRYCSEERTGLQTGPCQLGSAPPPGAPTIEVTGTFSAVRDDPAAIPM